MSAKNKILDYVSKRSRELKEALENPDIPSEERAAATTVLKKLDALAATCRGGSMIIKIKIPTATTNNRHLGGKSSMGKK
jgi:hypothetical protein